MKKKRLSKELIIISVLVLIIFLFTTTGYALYGRTLSIHGTAIAKKNGVVEITDLTLLDSSNIKTNGTTYSGTSINVDITYDNQGVNASYFALYQVTFENHSFYSYDFNSTNYTSTIDYGPNATVSTNYEITGLTEGETLPSGGTKTFTIKMITTISENHVGDISVEGTFDSELEQENIGSVIGSLTGTTSGDLTVDNSLAQFSVEVINSFEYNKTFTFAMPNNNFQIVNCSGGALGDYTIAANTTQTYQFCVTRTSGAVFASSPQTPSVVLQGYNIVETTVGTVSLTVPVDTTINDDDPPEISNISVTKNSTVGSVTLGWDSYEENSVLKYYIMLYKEVNGTYQYQDTYQTTADERQYTFTNLTDGGKYYFKVYGEDDSHNKPDQNAIDGAPQTGSSSCLRTPNQQFRWTYNVSYDLDSSLSTNGASTVREGATYTATLSASLGRRVPDSIQVKMGGITLSTSRNEYSYNNGSISIPNVSGDIEITASSQGCLVKGTKILLANGKTKNVEDITYRDLLAVWNYETGSITYEYPIWIEKEHSTNEYIEITFSDDTKLSIAENHGIYDANKNEFVEVSNPSQFKVGTEITKIKNGKLTTVKVKDIKTKKESTTYYHVVSTRYYNIIANDVLTTDDAVYLSNLYSFDKNIKFKYRKKVLKDKNNLYTYDELKDTIPYYMYKGLRAGEAKVLVNYKYLTTSEFKEYLSKNQMNKDMVQEPVTKDGKRYWMVTTSLDKVTNKDDYLYQEGNIYTLPNVKTKCFYNTSDNKCYSPGEKIKVDLGTHFIAK